jgi:hypothetical protein
MQASPDVGNVDVKINGRSFASDLAPRSVFPTPTRYSPVHSGNLRVQEVPTGSSSPDIVDAQISLSANNFYTLLTFGEQSTGTLATVTLNDDHSPVASDEIKIRLVNGVSTAGTLDIYLTSTGNDPVPTSPTIPAFGYKSVSPYMSFTGTGVHLCANPAGVVPGSSGMLGGVGSLNMCLLSVQYQVAATLTRSTTFLLLDPYLPPNAPPGSFTSAVVFSILPY